VRIETETTLGDGHALASIFERLGYQPVFTYEKYRTEWSDGSEPSGHVVIDETPIGNYAELEGPTDWIDRTLNDLRIDPATCITDSYGTLFLNWKQRTGSPARNLTFAEIPAPALAAR
jgi:adenylate cyclase class 2